MKLTQLYKRILENDEDHQDALEKTGFWGDQAAGAIILCTKTKRLLLQLRSADVQEPFTWAGTGGAMDEGETPEQTTRREIKEELNYSGNMQLKLIYVYKHKSGFKYYNFLGLVSEEFSPKKSTEVAKYKWFDIDNLPSRLHFGLKAVFNNTKAVKIIQKYLVN